MLSCTCKDWLRYHLPCKHFLASSLSDQLGSGTTFLQPTCKVHISPQTPRHSTTTSNNLMTIQQILQPKIQRNIYLLRAMPLQLTCQSLWVHMYTHKQHKFYIMLYLIGTHCIIKECWRTIKNNTQVHRVINIYVYRC